MRKLRVLSLFAGIGGFDLGLERTGGFETVAFCEIDPYATAVLKQHWPKVPVYGDVRELTAERLAADGVEVDLICGGFPCQDVSIAGAQAGLRDDTRSGLWSEITRLVGELRPQFLLVENVSNLLAGPDERPGGWFGRVLGDLASLGYNAEWHCIPAAYVGAPHVRDRVWLAAYPDSNGLEGRVLGAEIARGQAPLVGRHVWQNIPVCAGHGSRNGFPALVDRLRCLGNAVVPQIPELIGRAILASLEQQREAA
jgi:DNA (cytosine-5)-methyltransferase 1